MEKMIDEQPWCPICHCRQSVERKHNSSYTWLDCKRCGWRLVRRNWDHRNLTGVIGMTAYPLWSFMGLLRYTLRLVINRWAMRIRGRGCR